MDLDRMNVMMKFLVRSIQYVRVSPAHLYLEMVITSVPGILIVSQLAVLLLPLFQIQKNTPFVTGNNASKFLVMVSQHVISNLDVEL
jgi:hypothetical protein